MTKLCLYFQKKKEKRLREYLHLHKSTQGYFRQNATIKRGPKTVNFVCETKRTQINTQTLTQTLSLSLSLCKYFACGNVKRETIQAIMSCFRSNPSVLLLSFSLFFFFSISSSFGNSHVHHTLHIPGNNFALVLFVFVARNMFVNLCLCVCVCVLDAFVKREYGGVVIWNTRRSVAEESSTGNSSLILAEKRTYRKDPLDNFNRYPGGWNISNQHYWAVSVFLKHLLILFFSFWVLFFLS